MTKVEFANSIEPDEGANNESSHLGLPYFTLLSTSMHSQYDITWTIGFRSFANLNFDICFYGALRNKTSRPRCSKHSELNEVVSRGYV